MLAPIVIFAFNRPSALQRLFDSLSRCTHFGESTIYIYIDGARNERDKAPLEEVSRISREFLAAHAQAPSNLHSSTINKGLGASVIAGVSEVIERHKKVIVLEDDLICTPNFLAYMNQALDFYEHDARMFSVCGYGLKIRRPKGYTSDFYLSGRSSSWGWATWQDRWQTIDWEVSDWETFKADKKARKSFNTNGSDLFSMLRDYMEGKNKSWAIRFCYNQFKQGRYALTPFESKISNEGFGADATNCKSNYSRFKTTIDQSGSESFAFSHDLQPHPRIKTQCYNYHSLAIRIYSKLRNLINL